MLQLPPVATKKLLLVMRDCTVDSDDGTGDISVVLGIFARVWTRARVIARVSRHGLPLPSNQKILRSWLAKTPSFTTFGVDIRPSAQDAPHKDWLID